MRSWLDAERFQYNHYYRLMEENCDWKTATPSEISCGWSPELHKIRPRLAKQNTWYQQEIGPGLRMTAVQGVQDI